MSDLQITRALLDALLTEVSAWGAENAETGGFLLADEDRPGRCDVLALADRAGIGRRRDLFTISGGAIERLFSWAADSDLRIRAQVHSHAQTAFLSRTDLRYGFDVDGFTTAVIPKFAQPPADPTLWGWWTRSDGQWEAQQAPNVLAGSARIVRFDEEGVRAT